MRANADTGEDATNARRLGAEGIGLCRTEHMFLAPDRLPVVRRMILASTAEEEAAALDELRKVQQDDFDEILEAMDGLPVTVRLLDPPLHEFLPSVEELRIKQATEGLTADEQAMLAAAESWSEHNPMIGTRGVRLGVVKPGLYAMQVRALLDAAADLRKQGKNPIVEVMIPLTVTREELRARPRLGRRTEIDAATKGLRKKPGGHDRHDDRDAARRAARRRDRRGGRLLQLRHQRPDPDDVRLQPRRRREPDDAGLPGAGPAQAQPVRDHRPERRRRAGQASAPSAAGKVKKKLKLGVCGEHGGDPESIALFYEAGLDYVSCSRSGCRSPGSPRRRPSSRRIEQDGEVRTRSRRASAVEPRERLTPAAGSLPPWRSSTTTSSGCAPRCRSSTSSASTSRCARSGATGSGCARSTPSSRPSFNVREETGRYKCFGCDKSGDVFTFVQEIEHVDFVGAVEYLAGQGRHPAALHDDRPDAGSEPRRKQLIEAMAKAVEWYHQRLLEDPEARRARDYLRSPRPGRRRRPQFKLGWAPDDWDALARAVGHRRRAAAGDRAGVHQPVATACRTPSRARVLFPIFSDNGEPVAFGGRILPGSTDPAKYKNSPETPIYAKSKTLYGLNWAKADIVDADQVIVCEGYTDVIGFHRPASTRAVATCGTALTEDHVRLLKRFASRVVLAFDADAAGQGAAERFYEWEQKYQVQVAVARLPDGLDPGELAQRDPAALAAAVADALPFLGFRLPAGRWTASRDGRRRTAPVWPSGRWPSSTSTPTPNVRSCTPARSRAEVGLPVTDLVRVAEQRSRRPTLRPSPTRRAPAPRERRVRRRSPCWPRTGTRSPSGWSRSCSHDEANRRAFLALG